MSRFATLELERFPSRALLMAIAALAALAVDFTTKELAVALDPSTLLFNVSDRTPFGLGGTLILVAAATSLLACVVPARIVAVGAGIALGGGLGNLTSRYWWDAHGGSPDFIPFGDGSTGQRRRPLHRDRTRHDADRHRRLARLDDRDAGLGRGLEAAAGEARARVLGGAGVRLDRDVNRLVLARAGEPDLELDVRSRGREYPHCFHPVAGALA